MILGTLPYCFEHIRFRQQELNIVVCPRLSGKALQEHDHFLNVSLTVQLFKLEELTWKSMSRKRSENLTKSAEQT
jgi:hypothetical protein